MLRDTPFYLYVGCVLLRTNIISWRKTADFYDVDSCIKKANQQMGALRHIWNAVDIDWPVKYWIFLTGPVNTLLWGFESWAIMAEIREMINVFYHTSIRRILFIGMDRVKEERITNEMLRKQFINILPLQAFINRRI